MLLELRKLSVSYGKAVALEDVTLHIEAGEFVAVLGPNGAGKSTLLRCLSGLVRPSSGTVEVLGRPARAGRADVAHVLQRQEHNAQVPLTVPPEVKEKMREALGLGQAWYIQYYKWLIQFFWIEPLVFVDWLTNSSGLFGWLPDTAFSEGKLRVISWQTRSPVMDIVIQRMPQPAITLGILAQRLKLCHRHGRLCH